MQSAHPKSTNQACKMPVFIGHARPAPTITTQGSLVRFHILAGGA